MEGEMWGNRGCRIGGLRMVEIGEESGSGELRELQGIAELWARMDETARFLVVANGSNEERYRGEVRRCVIMGVND